MDFVKFALATLPFLDQKFVSEAYAIHIHVSGGTARKGAAKRAPPPSSAARACRGERGRELRFAPPSCGGRVPARAGAT